MLLVKSKRNKIVNKNVTKTKKRKYNRHVKHGGNIINNSIVIIGSGPTGLFTAIFIRHFLSNKISEFPNILIYGERLNKVGRLRQVIILKKEYGMIQKLFEIDELIKAPAIEENHSSCKESPNINIL